MFKATKLYNLKLYGFFVLISFATSDAYAISSVGEAAIKNTPVSERVPEGYESDGLSWVRFIDSPSISLGIENNDNIFFLNTNKISDSIYTVMPTLTVKSDWSRHSLNFDAKAKFNRYAKYDSENSTDFRVGVDGRVDTYSDNYLTAGIIVRHETEARSDKSSPDSATKRVTYKANEAQVGYVQVLNRFKISTQIGAVNYDFKDVPNSSGGLFDQDFRDRNEAYLHIRTDYLVTGDVNFYTTLNMNQQSYKQASSFRDSSGYDISIGSHFNLSHVVRGDTQIGYMSQKYKNPLFNSSKGIVYHSKILWLPTGLTTVTFNFDRAVHETPIIGAAGIITTMGGVTIDHELYRNVILTGNYNVSKNSFNGLSRDDDYKNVNLLVVFRLDKNVLITGGYEYRELRSTFGGGGLDYKDNALKASLKFSY